MYFNSNFDVVIKKKYHSNESMKNGIQFLNMHVELMDEADW